MMDAGSFFKESPDTSIEDKTMPSVVIVILLICCFVKEISADGVESDINHRYQRTLENVNKNRKADVESATRSLQPRIIGGRLATRDYGFYGSLNRFPSGCGASLVSPKFMLTAAHCVEHFIEALDFVNLEEIVVGAVCFHRETGKLQKHNCGQKYETFGIEEVYPHPQYMLKAGVAATHDFALLKLNGTSTITPIRMDQENSQRYDSDKILSVIGFGLTDTNDITIDALPDTLLEVDIKYVPEETCRDVYKWILDSSMMCAIDKDKDACSGDSGGPLIDKETQMLVGLVSWGSDKCGDINAPGVYSRISDQWEWIQNTICSNHDNENLPYFCRDWVESNTQEECHADQQHVSLELKTDYYGRETSWKILDDSNDEKMQGGPYLPFSDYKVSRCVLKSCHSFNLFDSFGDGIYGKYGGGVKLAVDGKLISSDKPFNGSNKSIKFGTNC